jgi:hypothetical protein
MNERCQGRKNVNMMADCSWSLKGEISYIVFEKKTETVVLITGYFINSDKCTFAYQYSSLLRIYVFYFNLLVS